MFQDPADTFPQSPCFSPVASVSGSGIQLSQRSHGSLHSMDTSDHTARQVFAVSGGCYQAADLHVSPQSIRQALPEMALQATKAARSSTSPPRSIPSARAETEWLPFINGAKRKKMHRVGSACIAQSLPSMLTRWNPVCSPSFQVYNQSANPTR